MVIEIQENINMVWNIGPKNGKKTLEMASILKCLGILSY